MNNEVVPRERAELTFQVQLSRSQECQILTMTACELVKTNPAGKESIHQKSNKTIAAPCADGEPSLFVLPALLLHFNLHSTRNTQASKHLETRARMQPGSRTLHGILHLQDQTPTSSPTRNPPIVSPCRTRPLGGSCGSIAVSACPRLSGPGSRRVTREGVRGKTEKKTGNDLGCVRGMVDPANHGERFGQSPAKTVEESNVIPEGNGRKGDGPL